MNISNNTEGKRILLTGGRAPCTLELARLFTQAGHRVYVAESAKYHLARASRVVYKSVRVPAPNRHPLLYIDRLTNVIREEQIDLLIPTCEEIFFISMGKEKLSQHCTVFVDDIERLEMLHHKWAFQNVVKQYGLLAPETWYVTSCKQARELLEQTPYTVVLKPVYSRFASSVHVVSKGEADVIDVDLPITPASPWVVQQYISGRPYCSYSVVHQGELVAHTAYETTFAAGKGASICFEHSDEMDILAWVREFAAKHRYTGQIAFDFIKTDAGHLYPLECNPRTTSGVHLFRDQPAFGQTFFHHDVNQGAKGDQRGHLEQGEGGHNRVNRVNPGVVVANGKQPSMLTAAMLLYGPASVNSWVKLAEWAKMMVTAKDVIFRWNDPGPFLAQFLVAADYWKQSVVRKKKMIEISTLDIEWNGEK